MDKEGLRLFIRHELIEKGLGVSDATDAEVDSLVDHSDPWPSSYIFADIISRRAQSGWATHGHSGRCILFSKHPPYSC